jgi:hypothetical protein
VLCDESHHAVDEDLDGNEVEFGVAVAVAIADEWKQADDAIPALRQRRFDLPAFVGKCTGCSVRLQLEH